MQPDLGINIENLIQTVHFLSTLDPPRNYKNLASLQMSAEYIVQKLKQYGLSPTRQRFTVSGRTYENIIASVGPVEGGRLIVGAHYDVHDKFPGADDNASAVAGLLEIARFAKRHEAKLSYRVDFVAFCLEEPPFFRTKYMGSYTHAESLHENNVEVLGMICLEMIGYFSDQESSQSYPLSLMRLFYPGTGDFIGVVGNFSSSSLVKQIAKHLKSTRVPVQTLRAPAFLTGVDFSDHLNYWKFGYKAVMVTDTAFYRNPNYHKPTDTIDTLNFKKMKEVIKGLCWAILYFE